MVRRPLVAAGHTVCRRHGHSGGTDGTGPRSPQGLRTMVHGVLSVTGVLTRTPFPFLGRRLRDRQEWVDRTGRHYPPGSRGVSVGRVNMVRDVISTSDTHTLLELGEEFLNQRPPDSLSIRHSPGPFRRRVDFGLLA